MKTILCLCDYGPNVNTGYATVSKNIVKQIKKYFGNDLKLSIVAVNYFGENFSEYDDTVEVVSARNSQNQENVPDFFKGGDPFGRLAFFQALFLGNFDGIFIIQDLGTIAAAIPMFKMIKKIKGSKGKDFKSIIYFPVDGYMEERVYNETYDKQKIKNVPKEYQQFFNAWIYQLVELDYFDCIVTFTVYGRQQIIKQRAALADRVKVVYHGTDINTFYPLAADDIERFKKKYFGWNANRYIIGVINRNSVRKDIPTAILGFIEACSRWPTNLPKPFLYLHMHPCDPAGWNLRKVLEGTDLVEGRDYMFPQQCDENYYVSTQVLNCIYNSIDVSLSTVRGGGWELPITEAMACKTPCIVPAHTSLAEISGNGERAFLLEEFLPICDPSDNRIMQLCHYEEIAEQLINVATNEVERNTIIEKAYSWAKELTWDKLSSDWIKYFSETYQL